jgi:hypothetical protein
MIQFSVDKNSDPDRSKLRGILEAQFTYERMVAARSCCVHLLAVTGVVIWLEVIWPDLLPSDIQFFSLTVFGGILFLVLRAAIEEVISRRKLKRLLAAKEEVAIKDTDEFFLNL